MAAIDWDFVITWLLGPGFGLLTILYLYQRDGRRLLHIDRPYLIYLLINSLWGLGILFAHPRIRDLPALVPFQYLSPYLLAGSPALLLLTTGNLLGGGRRQWRWLLLVPASLIVFATFHDGAIRSNLPNALVLGARRFDRDALWRLMLITANLTSVFAIYRLGSELYRAGWGLVYHNRLRLWLWTLTFVTIGDLLALTFVHPNMLLYLGGLIKLSGATLTTAILVILYMPTTHYLVRLFLSTLAMGLVTLGIAVIGVYSAWNLLPDNEQSATLLGMTFVSAIVAVVFVPIRRRVQVVVEWIVLGRHSTLGNVATEYNHRISQQMDMEQLTDTVMGLLGSALHLYPKNKGGVLAVANTTGQNQDGLRLCPVARVGQLPLSDLVCGPESPLLVYWQEGGSPLSQFDIELLPELAVVSKNERDCLAYWETELYIPLRSSERLIGLLALSPKQSGDHFNAAELRFLRSLTDQTVRALEQAQLLSDLKIANAQLTHLSDKLAQVNRRLYEADRLKSGFIGIITHELRTPFVSLALSFQIIERHGLEHLLPEQQEQLNILQKGVTELKQMVDHIIAFASLLSKQGELKTETVDLTPLIYETVEAIRPMAKSRKISIDARVWPGLPFILGDRERLAEAIYHLIHNAIKFNQPGGWVRVRCQPDNGNIAVRIQDNGTGIPPDRLEHLWSAFSQMADPLRRGVEGLGLGLALVRYVTVAHGGEVWAQSTEGEGSTFGFRVPALKAEDKPNLAVKR